MLARSKPGCQDALWKRQLATAITSPQELLRDLGLDPGLLPAACAASRHFRLLVPRGYAALMEHGNPNDPLLRQVLPRADELRNPPGFCADPVGDLAAIQTPGLLQKYQGRALLLVTGACAIHCRYCFRREFPYAGNSSLPDRSLRAVAKFSQDPSVREVILSGGDPLMLDDPALAALVSELSATPHLKRLRLHTRLPVVLPSRVTETLCRTLKRSRLKPIVVIHANHARELGAESRQALERLGHTGILMLNQSVLLRGVNDHADRLVELSEALFACGVLPYYLHLLDKVSGAAHFDLDAVSAVRLMYRVRARLPGYLVPRLVREVAGHPFKEPVEPLAKDREAAPEDAYGLTVLNHR